MGLLTESTQELAEASLFFVLSGEHASLPAAEVRAIMEANGIEYRNSSQTYRLMTTDAPQKALRVVSERSLMYDCSGIVLGESQANETQVEAMIRRQPLQDLTASAKSFAVRSMRLGGASKVMRRESVERDVGSLIKERVPRLEVKLENPDITFACVLYENKFMLGITVYSKPSGLIAPRRPRKRPIFHPSTMPPKIARCMVNLARAKPGQSFADPFSGVGGIAIEAAVIGCNVICEDANLRMLRGARKNIKYFKLSAAGFLNSDARFLPLRELDAIATDPPYGRGSSTMGSKVTVLVSSFLEQAKSSLRKMGHLCISAPSDVDVEAYANRFGFLVKEKHLAKVHRSLTRQFVVLQNS